MERTSWDDYFEGIAFAVAARSECVRAHHGAVIVTPDKRIRATGYNGTPSGSPLTCATDCPRAKLTYDELPALSCYDTGVGRCISSHAEISAIIVAGWDHCRGSTIYITGKSCDGCQKAIESAGIVRAVWPEGEWNK